LKGPKKGTRISGKREEPFENDLNPKTAIIAEKRKGAGLSNVGNLAKDLWQRKGKIFRRGHNHQPYKKE